jgi:predicted glycosyltransferase
MQHTTPKLLFISNEIRGLGHVTIALKICSSIQASLKDASMLLITASRMAKAFSLPHGLDIITLPAVVRMEGSLTQFRSLRLPLPFNEVSHLRQRIIRETALVYSPHLVIVDFRPAGVAGELLSVLKALKRRHAKLVLLLRDILDDPAVLRAKWNSDRALSALPLYDEIWVYGSKKHHNLILEHDFPGDIANKIRFCGYLAPVPPAASKEETRFGLGITTDSFLLVTTGNGLVGFEALETFVRALSYLPDNLSTFSLIVTGPELAPKDYNWLETQCQKLRPKRSIRLIQFTPWLTDYMAAADLVISLGGYNTVTEILSLGKRSIVIPYSTSSDAEQLIRASLLQRYGLIRMVKLNELSPEGLAMSILAGLRDAPPTQERLQELEFDFSGTIRIRAHMIRLLGRRHLCPGK